MSRDSITLITPSAELQSPLGYDKLCLITATGGATMQIDTCCSTLSNQLSLPTPALLSASLYPLSQSDWVLLAGSGFALIAIAVLLVIVAGLVLFVRRRSKRLAVRGDKSQLNVPTVVTKQPIAEAPTLPSAATNTGVPVAEAPTLPSITTDEDTTDPQPSRPEPAVETAPTAGLRPPNIGWRIAGLTHVGLKRKLNEDNLLILEATNSEGTPYGLYIVADGMGGHEHGEVASQLTIETIQAHFSRLEAATAPYEEWLRSTIMAANEAVVAHQADKNIARKMGSTLVMAMVRDDKATIANVGDSRAYHLTNDSMTQITEDHSLVERLVQIGQITREEARTHKQRNVIYSTIGDKTKLQIGLYQLDLRPGDRLLLCSDGLTGMLTDDQILNINRSYVSPVEACQILVKAANAAGGEDNITAILIEMDV